MMAREIPPGVPDPVKVCTVCAAHSDAHPEFDDADWLMSPGIGMLGGGRVWFCPNCRKDVFEPVLKLVQELEQRISEIRGE